MKNLILSLSLLAGLASTARAGIHLEPYLGYAKGTETNHTSSTQNIHKETYTGVGFGVRGGVSFLGLLSGLTYDHIGASGEDDDSPAVETDYKATNLGFFLGYEFPLGLRFWGTYYMSAKSEIEGKTGAADEVGDTYKGSGYAVGVGMSIVPMVLALNLEYKSLKYDEFLDASTGIEGSLGGADETGANYIFLSISAPIGF